MKKAKWIWINEEDNCDEYGEFVARFAVADGEKVAIKIACDGVYNVFLNGELVAFSGCADFPWYKFFDEVDITSHCKKNNELKVVVWHLGEDNQTYLKDSAGVIFEVVQNGNVLCYSDRGTLCRKMTEYQNGYKKVITGQLGYSFLYDANAFVGTYSHAYEVKKQKDLHKRLIKPLVLDKKTDSKIIKNDGSILIDLGRESAGFLSLDFESDRAQKLVICYGEHIVDGGVRRKIGTRDFSVEYVAKVGKNSYTNTFRRIAGRYIEVFCESPIKVNYIGLVPTYYPLNEKERTFNDPLTQKIYDTCIRTLRLCMHEHYEDCPWREQALYTLDSRNQMLCGYYAFDGTEYQRHNLILISKSIRADGLLSICAPSGTDVPIPFFSLCYVMQVYEYIKYTGDMCLLTEVKDVLTRIIKTFFDRVDETSLIKSLPYPYWNFYEWAEESNNEWQITRDKDDYTVSYDLILNCMYVYAVGLYNELLGDNVNVERVKSAIDKTFASGGVYKLSTTTERSSQLGNSLALLIGLGGKELAEKVANCDGMIEATLSMRAFVYDALLKTDSRYKGYIWGDIHRKYEKMLDSGATSFWETEKGESDFDGAGSLCHGWSALPVYYLNILSKD